MKTPNIVVVDDFLDDPHAVRAQALQQSFVTSVWYKGRRTTQRFLSDYYRQTFERLLGLQIVRWEEHAMNGTYQVCTSEDPIVYHADEQTHAAIIYLTPDAPPESGTSLWRSKASKARLMSEDPALFHGGFYDPTLWERVDQIGNVFNRLVVWNGAYVHSASCYFGQRLDGARLFQMFFFDCAPTIVPAPAILDTASSVVE